MRLAYRGAQGLRLLWWRIARPEVHGVKLVVLGPGRTVLLIRHSYARPELWMLPGGGVRQNEDAATAGAREVLEETGIVASSLRLHGTFLETARGARNHITVMIGEGAGGPCCDGREIIAAAWHPIDALPATIASGSWNRIVEVRDGLPPPGPDWP